MARTQTEMAGIPIIWIICADENGEEGVRDWYERGDNITIQRARRGISQYHHEEHIIINILLFLCGY